tara:strand:+ start:365 stop:961 length:597 start_codon:yes stop_codon:yes gene_type:complete
MPVFTKEDKRILYVHVPKTAGSSVLKLFKENGYEVSFFDDGAVNPYKGLCSDQHIHAEHIKEEFDLSDFSFIFSIFRNPVQRLISEYTWRCGKGGQRYPSLKYWVELIFDLYEQNNYINDNHIRPQSEFYFEECKVFDFNDIGNLNGKLSDELGLDMNVSFKKENASSYKYVLTDNCENLIKSFYKSDYEWLDENILH